MRNLENDFVNIKKICFYYYIYINSVSFKKKSREIIFFEKKNSVLTQEKCLPQRLIYV